MLAFCYILVVLQDSPEYITSDNNKWSKNSDERPRVVRMYYCHASLEWDYGRL